MISAPFPPPTSELVTLDFYKTYARISTDTEDDVLAAFLVAAREQAEAYCNRFFVSQEATRTYSIDQNCYIPVEDIISVSGAFTDVTQITDAYTWFVEYIKGFVISRDCPVDLHYLPTYTVRYQAHVDPATVPSAVKVAICKIASDLYENREFYGSHREMGVSAKTLLAPYRVLSK